MNLILAALAVVQIPLWILITICRQQGSWTQKIKTAFSPAHDWGPQEHFQEWKLYKSKHEDQPSDKYYVNSAFVIGNETPKPSS